MIGTGEYFYLDLFFIIVLWLQEHQALFSHPTTKLDGYGSHLWSEEH